MTRILLYKISRTWLNTIRFISATTMDSNGLHGKHRLNQLSHAYIHNLQLQWTPMGCRVLIFTITGIGSPQVVKYLQLQWTAMGSNGKHHLNQLSHAHIHNLQLQWTLMGSNGNHSSCGFRTTCWCTALSSDFIQYC